MRVARCVVLRDAGVSNAIWVFDATDKCRLMLDRDMYSSHLILLVKSFSDLCLHGLRFFPVFQVHIK